MRDNIEISFFGKYSTCSKSLSSDFDHISYLSSFGYFDLQFAFGMIDRDFSSQYHIEDTDRDFGIQIIIFSFIEFGFGYIDLDIKITDMMAGRFISLGGKLDIST
jgi:hypothetical protein